jgi:hypothetical protein
MYEDGQDEVCLCMRVCLPLNTEDSWMYQDARMRCGWVCTRVCVCDVVQECHHRFSSYRWFAVQLMCACCAHVSLCAGVHGCKYHI